MIILVEFITYFALSLGIAFVSTLCKDSISFVLLACAVSYGLLWWPNSKLKLVAPAEGLQLYRLIIGIAAGYWGAHLWTGPDPIWQQGAFCICLSFFFFLSGLPQGEAIPAFSGVVEKVKGKGKKALKVNVKKASAKTSKTSKNVKVNPWGVRLLIALAVLGVVMEYFFNKGSVIPAFVMIAFIIAATIWLQIIDKDVPAEQSVANEKYILWGLVTLTALNRFPFIWSHIPGFQIDEANDMQGAQDFLRNAVHSAFTTGWSGRATFPFAVYSDVFKIFGLSLPAARGLSVIFTILSVYYFYKLSRYFFGVTASTIGTLLFMTSWWCIWGSYMVIPMMMQDMGVLMALYFLEKGLREGRRSYFFWSGTMTAMTVMTYVWGRTAPLLVLAWFAVSLLFTEDAESFRKTRLWGVLAWLGGFFWLLGPFIGWLMQNQEFFGRIKELSMMSLVAKTGNYMLPVKTFYFTIISPFITYNIDERFALADRPLFDRVASFLLIIGIVLAFMALKKRSSWILILGIGACLPANALAVQNATPEPSYLNGLRFFCILPFVYWSVTYAIEGIRGWLSKEQEGFRKKATIFLAVVFVGAMGWNLKWGFYDFHKTGHWSRLGFNHILIADLVRQYSKDHDVYLCAEYVGSSVVQFLDYDVNMHAVPDDFRLPFEQGQVPTRSVIFILRAWGYAQPCRDNILKYCPHATVTTVNDREGQPYLWDIDVPLSDIQAMKPAKPKPIRH